MKRPVDWPRYMIAKRLLNGAVAYYWNAPNAYLKAGFKLKREPLGKEYGHAIKRAKDLNRHLDAWRQGCRAERDLDLQPGFGTLGWLVERYKRTAAWTKVSTRSRPDYTYILEIVLSYKLKNKKELRTVLVTSVSARGVDRLYQELQKSKRVARRLNTANKCMTRMARAWDVVQRLYPADVPQANPFRDVELTHSRGTTRAASRSEAYALHDALVAYGHPHLAIVPLVCFELHQRPENVIAGHLTWNDYRPSDRRDAIRIEHHKTGAEVWQPLKDAEHDLYPELCRYLDGLKRLGVPVVLRDTMPARPYRMRHARALVRKAADAAGLPRDLTLAACRHGGLTELGDAELTEQQSMAMSGHKSPAAHRVYVKRTERQRAAGARKRRAHVEQTASKIQNEDE